MVFNLFFSQDGSWYGSTYGSVYPQQSMESSYSADTEYYPASNQTPSSRRARGMYELNERTEDDLLT